MGPYIVVCDRARFFRKNPHRAKMTKNGQKWSLVFSGIRVKWKFLRLINILQKLHAWEKSGSQVIVKNEISVFFNRQYFTNRLISDDDFWHVDRHEWKKQGSLQVFRKNFHFEKWGISGPKIAHAHNSGSSGRIFFLILYNESDQ